MKAKDIMTVDPACCTPDTKLEDAARMMCERDCGEIPVVESSGSRRPIGVITDRDITCRTVAKGTNPLEAAVGDYMTRGCVTTSLETSIEDCVDLLEEHQIRRLPVVDGNGALCGIVSQADIARNAPKRKTAELVKEVSQPKR